MVFVCVCLFVCLFSDLYLLLVWVFHYIELNYLVLHFSVYQKGNAFTSSPTTTTVSRNIYHTYHLGRKILKLFSQCKSQKEPWLCVCVSFSIYFPCLHHIYLLIILHSIVMFAFSQKEIDVSGIVWICLTELSRKAYCSVELAMVYVI